MKYIRSNHRFQDEEHRKAWFLKVTVNATKSLLTSAWHRHYAHIEGTAEESCCVEENDSDVYYAVQNLPEKIIVDFSKRLGDRKQLKKLYQNTENNFTDEMLVSGEEIEQLSQRIQSAKIVSEEFPESGNKVYYMAEFCDGDIIKFVVADDIFFIFNATFSIAIKCY